MQLLGPTTLVHIDVPELVSAQFPDLLDHPAVPLTALFDTGASHTVIAAGTSHMLGLKAGRPTRVKSVTETESGSRYRSYRVQVSFRQMGFALNCTVAEGEIHIPGVQCLIGRDILSHGKLTYEGRDRWFSFEV